MMSCHGEHEAGLWLLRQHSALMYFTYTITGKNMNVMTINVMHYRTACGRGLGNP